VPPRPEPPADLDLDDERRSLILDWSETRPSAPRGAERAAADKYARRRILLAEIRHLA